MVNLCLQSISPLSGNCQRPVFMIQCAFEWNSVILDRLVTCLDPYHEFDTGGLILKS